MISGAAGWAGAGAHLPLDGELEVGFVLVAEHLWTTVAPFEHLVQHSVRAPQSLHLRLAVRVDDQVAQRPHLSASPEAAAG